MPTPRTDSLADLPNEVACDGNGMSNSSGHAGPMPRLEEPQIFPLLPIGDRLVKAIPLVLLMQRVEPVHGVAEDMLGERIGGEAGDRLIEVPRQRLHLAVRSSAAVSS